jgi:ketosteroid isomerase-like protein
MQADAQTQAAVMATLEQFKHAYEQRDLQGLLALFAPDSDVVLVGTGADERRVGLAEIRAQAERDWAQAEAFAVEWGGTWVSAAGPVAWVTAEAVGRVRAGGQEMELPLRLTVVLEQRGGRWLWMQVHTSVPATGQAEGESYPETAPH